MVQEYGKIQGDGICQIEVQEILGWMINIRFLPSLTLFEFLCV